MVVDIFRRLRFQLDTPSERSRSAGPFQVLRRSPQPSQNEGAQLTGEGEKVIGAVSDVVLVVRFTNVALPNPM